MTAVRPFTQQKYWPLHSNMFAVGSAQAGKVFTKLEQS